MACDTNDENGEIMRKRCFSKRGDENKMFRDNQQWKWRRVSHGEEANND